MTPAQLATCITDCHRDLARESAGIAAVLWSCAEIHADQAIEWARKARGGK